MLGSRTSEKLIIVAAPLEGPPVTVAKFKVSVVVKPSSSLTANDPLVNSSSSTVPVVAPSNLAGSFTAFTVMLISWVAVLSSSSVIVTVNVSVPLKFVFGV